MEKDNLLLWIVVLILLAAVAITVVFAPRRSRHGYGLLHSPDSYRTDLS